LFEDRPSSSEVDLHTRSEAHAAPGLNDVDFSVRQVCRPRVVGAILDTEDAGARRVFHNFTDDSLVVVVAMNMVSRYSRAKGSIDVATMWWTCNLNTRTGRAS
jgi:hypothetical protein